MKSVIVIVVAVILLYPNLAEAQAGKLFEAIKSNDLEQAEVLLTLGSDPNAKDNTGKSPLHYAADGGHVKACELLLANGANLNAKDYYGNTPLFFAAINGHKDICVLLLEKGADFNVTDNNGNTPLLMAASNGYKEICELLLTKGANINVKNRGVTPLHVAARNGHKNVCEFLLVKGADINAIDDNGNTPLLYASFNGHNNTCELLLSKGANANVKTKEGEILNVLTRSVLEVEDSGSEIMSFNLSSTIEGEEKMSLRSYGNTYNLTRRRGNWGNNSFVLRMQGERSGPAALLAVETTYLLKLAPKNIPTPDYTKYMAVVTLLKKHEKWTATTGSDIPTYVCEVGGDDPQAGPRRFPIILNLPEGKKADFPSIGQFRGTRVVLEKGVNLTLKWWDGVKFMSRTLSGGAFEVTLDGYLRILGEP